jgi:hypothetical protein
MTVQEQAGGLNPDYCGELTDGDLREWLREIRDNPTSRPRARNSAIALLSRWRRWTDDRG